VKSTASSSVLDKVTSATVRNVIFSVWALRDHPRYFRYFREYQRSQFFSREQIGELQFQRLRALLQHAYKNCPFYRCRMDEASLSPSSIGSIAALSGLPVLTKGDIQEHGAQMLATNMPAGSRIRNQTGGSTGSPLQFYVDKERFDSRMASTDRHNRWVGLRPGDWHAHLWGARLDHIIHGGFKDQIKNHLLYRRIELNTSCITDEDWITVVRKLRQQRPRFMIAYAKSAVLFANYMRENGINDLHFDAVITTAEVLFPEDRELLEKTFECEVFNRYGCREVSVIASECEHHRMHVNAEALLVEIVPDAKTPAVGKILITDLLNYSMPLIRYEIGDVGEWSTEQYCPCGRGLPVLRDVQGRTTDFLELSDGRKISGPALTLVVADMPDVRQVQFVQHELRKIALRVVPGRGYGEHTKVELRKRLSLYLGELVDLQVEETTRIASESSGKYRFVISYVGSTNMASLGRTYDTH
jgi:phenylacetate-CoA ligase